RGVIASLLHAHHTSHNSPSPLVLFKLSPTSYGSPPSTAIHPAQPSIFAIDAFLLFGWIRMQFALMNFADQSFHSHPYIVDNRLVDRVRDDRVFRRTEQQITAIRSDARIGVESVYRQLGIGW